MNIIIYYKQKYCSHSPYTAGMVSDTKLPLEQGPKTFLVSTKNSAVMKCPPMHMRMRMCLVIKSRLMVGTRKRYLVERLSKDQLNKHCRDIMI